MPYKKYFIYREEISIDGGLSWISTGKERLSGDPIGEYTTREGCESSTQYRWVNMDPSVDYYCLGSVKFYKQKKQVSYDGIHWKDITPAEYQKGDVIVEHSADCSTDVKKLVVEYSDGSTREVECGGGYLTSDEVKSLGDYNEMTYAIIGDCTVDIDNACFKGFTKLKYAALSSGQTYVPENCFSGCTSLQGVYIPSGITSLTSYVFEYCSSLTSIGPKGSGASIEIPSGVTEIGGYTFAYCSGLTSVTIPDSVTTIENNAFESCTSLASFNIPSGVTAIDNSVFHNCSSLTSIGPKGSGASIEIPSGVTTIGEYAFANCVGLTSVSIPNNVQTIGSTAFNQCKAMTSVEIGSGVTSIGTVAFAGCSGLTSVTIPNNLRTIGDRAFISCGNLQSVICLAITPPTLGSRAFDDTNNCDILVTASSVSAYKYSWSRYANRIRAIQ